MIEDMDQIVSQLVQVQAGGEESERNSKFIDENLLASSLGSESVTRVNTKLQLTAELSNRGEKFNQQVKISGRYTDIF